MNNINSINNINYNSHNNKYNYNNMTTNLSGVVVNGYLFSKRLRLEL